jgi:hypothetical protein
MGRAFSFEYLNQGDEGKSLQDDLVFGLAARIRVDHKGLAMGLGGGAAGCVDILLG